MQKYEKRILRYILAEKITSAKNDLKNWPFFHQLKSEFIPHIHMVVVYGKIYHFSLYCLFWLYNIVTYTFLYIYYIL